MDETAGTKPDFRRPDAAKWAPPRAVADGAAGVVLACAELPGTPDRAFRAFTKEPGLWWGQPGLYLLEDWRSDVRPCGAWSVTVRLADGGAVREWGEFCEVDAPHRLVMTRNFERNPLLGGRQTTLTCRFEPIGNRTRATLREEGLVGRSEAAYGNAENWERVLGMLTAYLAARSGE